MSTQVDDLFREDPDFQSGFLFPARPSFQSAGLFLFVPAPGR